MLRQRFNHSFVDIIYVLLVENIYRNVIAIRGKILLYKR